MLTNAYHSYLTLALINALPVLDSILPDALAPWRSKTQETLEAKQKLKELFAEGMKNADLSGMPNWASTLRKMPEFEDVEKTTTKLAYSSIDLFGAGSESVAFLREFRGVHG